MTVTTKKAKERISPDYLKIERSYKPAQKVLSDIKPSRGERVKVSFSNLKNIATNVYDQSVGYLIAKGQNRKAVKYLKQNPDSKDPVLYMMAGVKENIGSQWKLAKLAKKKGMIPVHLKSNHSDGPEKTTDYAFEQAGDLHKKTGMKNIGDRNDKFTGHSSGGNVGLYIATDKRAREYGIKSVHARAPTPTGMKVKGLAAKVLSKVIDTKPEDTTGLEGRTNVERLHKRGKTKIPVYIQAGKNDYFIPPSKAIYKHAKGMQVIDHKDSTHFGTSGANNEMNKIMIDLINNPKKYSVFQTRDKKYKKAG